MNTFENLNLNKLLAGSASKINSLEKNLDTVNSSLGMLKDTVVLLSGKLQKAADSNSGLSAGGYPYDKKPKERNEYESSERNVAIPLTDAALDETIEQNVKKWKPKTGLKIAKFFSWFILSQLEQVDHAVENSLASRDATYVSRKETQRMTTLSDGTKLPGFGTYPNPKVMNSSGPSQIVEDFKDAVVETLITEAVVAIIAGITGVSASVLAGTLGLVMIPGDNMPSLIKEREEKERKEFNTPPPNSIQGYPGYAPKMPMGEVSGQRGDGEEHEYISAGNATKRKPLENAQKVVEIEKAFKALFNKQNVGMMKVFDETLKGVGNSIGAFFTGLAQGNPDAFKNFLKSIVTTFISSVQAMLIAADAALAAKGITSFGLSLITDAPLLAAGWLALEAAKGFIQGLNQGGQVQGFGNSDTVPAMLTPGEFVIRKNVVNQLGVDFLSKLNSGADISALASSSGLYNKPGPKVINTEKTYVMVPDTISIYRQGKIGFNKTQNKKLL